MNMESNEKPIINRIKVVLVEQRRTNKWLAEIQRILGIEINLQD